MKPKKEKLSALKKKADAIFSRYIRQRDHGTCITCGVQKSWKEMQAGHYVSRVCLVLRYNPRNVFCQCYSCNCMKHGDLITYREKLVERYGEEEIEDMEKMRFSFEKFTNEKYHSIIDFYSMEIKRHGWN